MAHLAINQGFSEGERGEIAALYWAAFGPKLGRLLGPEPRALRFLAEAAQPEYALCLRAGGQLLGVVGFRLAGGGLMRSDARALQPVYGRWGAAWRVRAFEALAEPVGPEWFLLEGLAVRPDARGQGAGRALVAALKAEARARGYGQMRLDVSARNMAAQRLYAREGFRALTPARQSWPDLVLGVGPSLAMGCTL